MRATAHTTGSSFKIYPKLLYMLHIRSHSISLFARQLITDFTIQHHYIHISYSVQLHIAAVRCLICFVHSIYLLGSVFVLVYKYTSHTLLLLCTFRSLHVIVNNACSSLLTKSCFLFGVVGLCHVRARPLSKIFDLYARERALVRLATRQQYQNGEKNTLKHEPIHCT